MSVKVDPDGRRWVAVEAEVPGTPEEVWQAISTGPGVSSWFVPCTIDGREGGKMVIRFGPDMDSVSTIDQWQPPHRFAASNPGWTLDSPPIATEWVVEAKSGGTCVVRVVHSLFAATDDWDNQLTGTESGWPVFFHILRLKLIHFRGQPSSTALAVGMAAGSHGDVWDTLAGHLGLAGATVGERRAAGAGAPPLAGVVELVSGGDHPGALVRMDGPTPGVACLVVCPAGGQAMVSVTEYLFGAAAADAAPQHQATWQAWLAERFPAAA